jgi:hypothetical protein
MYISADLWWGWLQPYIAHTSIFAMLPGLHRPLSSDQCINGLPWTERFCIFKHFKQRCSVVAYGIPLALQWCVDTLLVFKAVSFTMIALCALTALVVLLISARKERDFGPPIRGVVSLALVVAGLCAALALLFAYQLQRQISEVQRLDRVDFRTAPIARPS